MLATSQLVMLMLLFVSAVGYGDLVPTSATGRVLSCLLMMVTFLLLALPVGVIGSNFTHLYSEKLDLDWKTASSVIDVDSLDAEGIINLFKEFDTENTGYIKKKNFRAAFRKAGIEGSNDFFDGLFFKADVDESGKITMNEFVGMCNKMKLARRGVTARQKKSQVYKSKSGQSTKAGGGKFLWLSAPVARGGKIFPREGVNKGGTIDATGSGDEAKSSPYHEEFSEVFESGDESEVGRSHVPSVSENKIEKMKMTLLHLRKVHIRSIHELDEMLQAMADVGTSGTMAMTGD